MRTRSLFPMIAGIVLIISACDSGPEHLFDTTSPPLLVVAPSVAFIREGGTIRLILTARDENGQPERADGATWTTSNTGVAPVSSDGVVTGHVTGVARITAYWNGLSSSATISVVGDTPGGGQPCGSGSGKPEFMKICIPD